MNNDLFFRRFTAWLNHASGKRQAITPPGPRGLPVLGSLLDMWRDPPQLLLESSLRYGDVFHFKLGPQPFFFASHPEAIKHMLQDNHRQYIHWPRVHETARPILGHGLLTSEGETWRRHHNLLQPAFHRKRLGGLVSTMAEATAEIIARWDHSAESHQPIEVHAEMSQLTLAIVTRALYGQDAGDQAELVGRSLAQTIRHTAHELMLPFKLPEIFNRRFLQTVAALDRIVYGIIENRQRHPKEHNDLLAMLMEAREDEASGGQGLSAQELRDEVMTLLVTGHETTTNALTWMCHLLTQNQAVERELHAEARQVLGGRAPTFEDLSNLPYAFKVVQEGLRLYPTGWLLCRCALADDELGGWTIPAGSIILFSPYVTHRLPAHWPNPEVFDPERFSEGQTAQRSRYTYFPFGGGPRQCIGNNFALMEAQVVIAMLAQRYRLEPLPGQTIDPRPTMDMRPRQPMRMRVVRWDA
jgi:cytochrome P450